MNSPSKNLTKTAILTMSFVQMGTNGIAPILAQIAAAFPEASPSQVQFLMTFPSIFCMILALSTTVLTRLISKKLQALLGLVIVAAAGVLACCFHGSLGVLYLWAAVLGVGCGMVGPLAPALINELFTGDECRTMLGWQNSAANVGSMLMTFLGGILALAGWNFGYLVYLLAVPGFLFTCIGISSRKQMPAERAPEQGSGPKPKFRLVVWREIIVAVLFLMLYSAVPANVAMLAEEKALGGTAVSGVLSALFLLGGIVSGLFYGPVAKRLGHLTAALGVLCLALGTLLLSLAGTLPLALAGCVLAGFSISLIMPSCMGAAVRLPGYETVNTSLILGFGYVGIFITPLLTTLAEALFASPLVAKRFLLIAILSVLFLVLTLILKPGRTEKA